jgi:predicted DNA-binding transcriptional regulator AlpA
MSHLSLFARACPVIDTTELPIGARLLSSADIAVMLRISPRTLWRLIAAGLFPDADVRLNRKLVRWTAASVQAWIDRTAASGPADPDAPVKSCQEAPADLIVPKRAARSLGVSVSSVYRYVSRGLLRGFLTGSLLRVSEANVNALLVPVEVGHQVEAERGPKHVPAVLASA